MEKYKDHANQKNTVVLKNLPSNLVEEAIVVFKNKKTVKDIEKIEKESGNIAEMSKANSKRHNKFERDYAIKEAEMLVKNYILALENRKKLKYNKKADMNNKKLKLYSICTTCALIVETIFFLVIK